MLIDFSDLLQVNVFELGHTYLQLVQTLNLRLPLVDPSHYISRFAALLEFGDETHQVAMDAVRLVQRFDRDWLTRGRRPAGICGACLLLAARMNNFRRSVAEIVQVVKIADTTLKKRLEEFKRTSSGALTLADFRSVWLEEEMDPPAYTKGREKEEREREEREGGGIMNGKGKRRAKGTGKKKKRKRGEETEDEEELRGELQRVGEDIEIETQSLAQLDPSLFNEGILAGTSRTPLFLPEDGDGMENDVDSSLPPPSFASVSTLPPPGLPADKALSMPPRSPSPLEATVNAAVEEEVAEFLANAQGAQLNSALDEAEQRRLGQFSGDDELLGLDEEELDKFILTEEEVRIKERVWVELNKDYLEAIAAKSEQQQNEDKEKKSRKRRKTSTKPRDASTPHGSTAAESARNLIKKNPKYSKRINYDALNNLFTDGGAIVKTPGTPGPYDDDKDDDGLYTFDDKSDGEGMVLIEEGGGGVGMAPSRTRSASEIPQVAGHAGGRQEGELGEGDEDAIGEDDVEGSDKGEDYADWDAYEQEV